MPGTSIGSEAASGPSLIGLEIAMCAPCGWAVRIIASTEDPDDIKKTLTHLDSKAAEPVAGACLPPARATSQLGLFD